MILNNRELSVLFTLLCYMIYIYIYRNESLSDDELSLYHRFLNDGWVDTLNQKRDLMKELTNV